MSDVVSEEGNAGAVQNDAEAGVSTEVKGNVSEEIRKVLEWEVGKLTDVDGVDSKASKDTEGHLDPMMLTEDDDIFTAVYNETGIEIVSRGHEFNGEANEENAHRKIENLQENVSKDGDDKLITSPEGFSNAESDEITQNAANDDNKIKTDGLDSVEEADKMSKSHDEVKEMCQSDKQDDEGERAGDQNVDQSSGSEKERINRSDSKETDSPFMFPTAPAPKSEIPKPKNPLSKLIEPSTRRLGPSPKSHDLPKRSSSSAQILPSKSRSQNQSTESLNTSRIPRANAPLGRSMSMVAPRVTSPVPSKGDKTPVKKPVQKIPWLIHAQRRPGVLKRSVSVLVPRKRTTEMAEGMTLVLAVPVTHTTQSVSRSSGDVKQPFIISPYQEEHVLAATCPISGITRHIKIIL